MAFNSFTKRGDGEQMFRSPDPIYGAAPEPQAQAAILTQPAGAQTITGKDLTRGAELLTKYKQGKQNLEQRIVEDELWWKQQHWQIIRRKAPNIAPDTPEPTSGWLFNSIMSKHADAMDNYPEPIVLPREQSDEESAKTLSSILPVIMEQCSFEQTYSDAWWEKLKHGTAAYGVFWNPKKENGLGDIDIQNIDLLKLFWEPGCTDVQQSRNLFIVDLVDEDLLDQLYPEHAGKMGGKTIDVKEYIYDDNVDTANKSVVVDWYYKVQAADGRTLVHLIKFVGDVLLYASENDPQYAQRGYYDHGRYPVVLDTLFPEKGTPVGFGYVAINRDPQLYIDKLSANILENAQMTTKKRFFVSNSTGVNETEFNDFTKRLVHVEGNIDDTRIKEIVMTPLSGLYPQILQMKIDEMKETSNNRDANNGSAGSGVTAAAAIAALQEAGNKTSRDMIATSYRSYSGIVYLEIELARQFYDETRAFRITAPNGNGYAFVDFSNSMLKDQPIGLNAQGAEMFRRPIFDLKIKAQKKNPFSRMEQNERAKELYGLGFFNPQRAQEAMLALDMMEFEGIDKVREKVQQGETLMNICQQQAMQIEKLSAIVQAVTGADMGAAAPQQGAAGPQQRPQQAQETGGAGVDAQVKRAQTPMTSYGQRLAKRSSPSMEAARE